MTQNQPFAHKRKFPTLGEVEYRFAATAKEMEDALTLLYQEYSKRRLIQRENYKNEIRVSPFHIVPETRLLVGVRNGEVIITLTLFWDSPLGLPMDTGYHEEAQSLRDQGRKIGEPGYLAVKSGLYRGKKRAQITLEKLDFITTIIRVAMQYTLWHTDIDDMCFITNPDPKRKFFKLFPFETVGTIKHYGFDEVYVNPKPAIAKRMNFRKLRKTLTNPLAFFDFHNAVFRIAIGPQMPAQIFEHSLQMTKENLRYFFVEKSDAIKEFKPHELEYVLSRYKISQKECDAWLQNQSFPPIDNPRYADILAVFPSLLLTFTLYLASLPIRLGGTV